MSIQKKRLGRPKGTKIARKSIGENEYMILMHSLQSEMTLYTYLVLRHQRSFILIYNLGLRVGELLLLRVGDIRDAVKTGESQLEGTLTKSKKARLLQFSPKAQKDVYEVFQDIIEDTSISDYSYLFPSRNPLKALNKANFTLKLNEYMNKVLGSCFTTHSFRQGLISDMIVKYRVPVIVVQKYIGHSSITTTLRYIKVTTEDTQNAINQVR